MRLDVRYLDGDPVSITSALLGSSAEYKFTIEGTTARLIGVRPKSDVASGESALELIELNQVHDAVLELPFIERVTVWMRGRTDTEPEKPASALEGSK